MMALAPPFSEALTFAPGFPGRADSERVWESFLESAQDWRDSSRHKEASLTYADQQTLTLTLILASYIGSTPPVDLEAEAERRLEVLSMGTLSLTDARRGPVTEKDLAEWHHILQGIRQLLQMFSGGAAQPERNPDGR